LNDFALYTKVRDGDIRAYETLFRRYYEPLCLYVNKITKDIDVAEEIVQELFFKLWKDRASLRIICAVKPYLYGAAKNQSLQYLEHLKVREHYYQKMIVNSYPESAPYDSPQEILEYKELVQRFDVVMGRMPKRRRDIFRMSRFEGMKYEQIAQEMSLSVKTIEAEMSKALQVLRKSLKFEV